MCALISDWLDATPYGLSSTHPDSRFFDPDCYWRGPVWLHINWLLALGLADCGEVALADRLKSTAQDCVDASGFWEYFDAESGAGCGGSDFSWTAATALHWLVD